MWVRSPKRNRELQKGTILASYMSAECLSVVNTIVDGPISR